MLSLYALTEMCCKGHILCQEVLHNFPYRIYNTVLFNFASMSRIRQLITIRDLMCF